MKRIANIAKVVIAIQMTFMFILLPDRTATEIVILCLSEYAIFAPIDASVLIKNIKGGA